MTTLGTVWAYRTSYYINARAVRGGTVSSAYANTCAGTVTDTSTGLMWQEATANPMTVEQALSYCESLNLCGYTDWRLPTIKELHSLVDYNRYNPAINPIYFPNTVAGSDWPFYWTSTTNFSFTQFAWAVTFYNGFDTSMNGGEYKYNNCRVRAVRGGNVVVPTPPILSVSPVTQYVTKDAGGTSFNVSNTGTGTMPWTATIKSGSHGLLIPPGTSGTNTGTINCYYAANTTISTRTATIRITAGGALGSPQEVTVTQTTSTQQLLT